MPVALHNESKSATSASNSGDVASTCDESHADSSNSVSRIEYFYVCYVLQGASGQTLTN